MKAGEGEMRGRKKKCPGKREGDPFPGQKEQKDERKPVNSGGQPVFSRGLDTIFVK
jgi:hypothetical protein